ERTLGLAGALGLVELGRERGLGPVEIVVDRGAAAGAGGEQGRAVGGARVGRGVVVEARGLLEPTGCLVAACERRLDRRDRRIERERLLEVDLGLRRIVELLLVDQRELEVERAAIARAAGGGDLVM